MSKSAFKDLQELKYLYLDNNLLKKGEEGMFEGLTSLKELKLSKLLSWAIKFYLLDGFDVMTTVISLNTKNIFFLGRNLIKSLPGDNFKSLKKLELLDLSNNKIQSIDDRTFVELVSLKTLYLSKKLIFFFLFFNNFFFTFR